MRKNKEEEGDKGEEGAKSQLLNNLSSFMRSSS